MKGLVYVVRYVLPDSRTMRVGAERFLAPEILQQSQKARLAVRARVVMETVLSEMCLW